MDIVNKVLAFLKGKKTYTVAIVMALATAANLMGWIDASMLGKVEAFLVSLGLMTLRAGISK